MGIGLFPYWRLPLLGAQLKHLARKNTKETLVQIWIILNAESV